MITDEEWLEGDDDTMVGETSAWIDDSGQAMKVMCPDEDKEEYNNDDNDGDELG